MAKINYFLPAIALFFVACDSNQKVSKQNSQDPKVFPPGERITNTNFTGEVYLHNLIAADSINQNAVGSVTFAPGARTHWHSHPGGQIILAIEGVGYYQEQGKEKVIVRKGEAVKCPADIPHWHGASADTAFVQVAITGRDKGETLWLEPVTEEEYSR
ncbi:cupin domain-containing protein [Sphingobacterium tabacisoli]|uniref:Cupin domain-containing protein n=1 Tax=Sphingobacterium tabacisoli TaxID=2044855 RepID=A0ABW5LAX1_9SPHI|nr:cupin domain-containing protein [Sphingobacterium tabacisoli]